MRSILTLSVILLFSLNAQANTGEPQKGEIEVEMFLGMLEVQMSAVGVSAYSKEPTALGTYTNKIAILYKMKENIIRRELSFIPGKKWLKWV